MKKIPGVITLCICLLLTAGSIRHVRAYGQASIQEQQTLRIADRSIIFSVDPAGSMESSYLVKNGVGEMLFKVGKDSVIRPLLAESIEQMDTTHWHLSVRQGVTFWSGKTVDADAVIASLERSRALNSKAGAYLYGISLTKAGDYGIMIETKAPNVMVPLVLSNFQLIIHNADFEYRTEMEADFTGMYRIDEYVPNDKVILSKNQSYWGEQPAISRISYEQITDDQERVEAALSGRYHIVLNIPADSIQRFREHKTVSIMTALTDSTQTIYFNLRQPQLKDNRVRQALSWGLDRKLLIARGMAGQGSPVTTYMGANPLFYDIKTLFFDQYDPGIAETLLDAAGWKKGQDGLRHKKGQVLRIRLMTWGTEKALGEAIQEQWKIMGIDTVIAHVDYQNVMTAYQNGDWDAGIEAWSSFGDPASMLNIQYAPGGCGNYGGYDDLKTNQLLQQLETAQNDEVRHALVSAVSEQVAIQSPAVYLCPRTSITAVSNRLDGFEPHFRQIEHVITADLRLN